MRVLNIPARLSLRRDKEEKLMLELFPDHYPEYQQQTKRLVPFVW